MGFRHQTLNQRIYGTAGRIAEQKFIEVMAERGHRLGPNFIRSGHDGVDTSAGLLASCSLKEQARPDFLGMGGYYYEVKGCGEDGLLKLKARSLEGVSLWNDEEGPVRWFLYNSHLDEYWQLNHGAMIAATQTDEAEFVQQLPFSEGEEKPGWLIPWTIFSQFEVVDAWSADKVYRKRQN